MRGNQYKEVNNFSHNLIMYKEELAKDPYQKNINKYAFCKEKIQ